jgi:hypothetical protein
MDITALLLSRLQFAFTVSFHIIFPSFTIGLAAWLTLLESLHAAPKVPMEERFHIFTGHAPANLVIDPTYISGLTDPPMRTPAGAPAPKRAGAQDRQCLSSSRTALSHGARQALVLL